MMVFQDIYKRNAWNGTESLSGPGSGSAATKNVASAILDLVLELGIESVFDAACGDGFWMPDLPGYIGIDVAEEALVLSRERHPNRSYFQGDVRTFPIPQVDLLIFRDVMQHQSLADGLEALNAIRQAKPKWMLLSTYIAGENVDITPEIVRIGMGYCPDLTAPPFSMPAPERYIQDGWDWEDPDSVRDPRKMLGLWPSERAT